MQILLQHITNQREHSNQPSSIIVKKYKIVGVSDVISCFQSVFCPFVEAVQVDIGEELGG